MYVFIKSDDSSEIHVGNTSCDFISELSRPINLDGIWSCALVDCNIGDKAREQLIVCCDIVDNSLVHGKELPILSIISKSGTLDNPYYMTISRNFISRIRVTILNIKGQVPTTKPSTSRFVLHMRQV